LVWGNSLVHAGADYIDWWGAWGMAASTRANDFCHKLMTKLRLTIPTAIVDGYNIASWEVAHTTYDKSNFDKYFVSNRDLVVIRLGENISNTTGLATSVQSLIDYIESKTSARILMTGVFWTDATKDSILSNAATVNGLGYTELSSLNTVGNRSSIGAQVYGEDGNLHTITHSGVALHPNDTGMSAIADKIYAII